jgi:hypothetical protein
MIENYLNVRFNKITRKAFLLHPELKEKEITDFIWEGFISK